LRRKEKALHKIEPGHFVVLTRFHTALGSFSVLTDPALLARLEIVEPRYSIVAHYGNTVSCGTADAFFASLIFTVLLTDKYLSECSNHSMLLLLCQWNISLVKICLQSNSLRRNDRSFEKKRKAGAGMIPGVRFVEEMKNLLL